MDGKIPNGTPDYVDIFGYDHHVLYVFYLTTGEFFVASFIVEYLIVRDNIWLRNILIF